MTGATRLACDAGTRTNTPLVTREGGVEVDVEGPERAEVAEAAGFCIEGVDLPNRLTGAASTGCLCSSLTAG